MLNVGTNFAPEHLEEMFEEPRLDLNRMEVRFRPYVEQATYYQFLKGGSGGVVRGNMTDCRQARTLTRQ